MRDILNESPTIGLYDEYPLSALLEALHPVFAWNDRHEIERPTIGVVDLPLAAEEKDGTAAIHRPGLRPFYPLRGNRKRQAYTARYPVSEDLQRAATLLIELTLEKSGLVIVGSKIPNIASGIDVDAVRRVYPTCRFVLMLRNPQTCISSILNRRNLAAAGLDSWHIADIGDAIASYHRNLMTTLSLIDDFPDGCFTVKYEDLLRSEADVVGELQDFLGTGVPFTGLAEAERASLNVLSYDELAAVRNRYAELVDCWDGLPLTGPGRHTRRHLQTALCMLPVDEVMPVSPGASGASCLGTGWHEVELGGAWSACERAHVYFRVPRDGRFLLQLELEALLSPQSTLDLTISHDGRDLFQGLLTKADGLIAQGQLESRIYACNAAPSRFMLGPISCAKGQLHDLRFHVRDPKTPAELGISADGRRLGVKLSSIQLRPME
jgi:hypothetical protein